MEVAAHLGVLALQLCSLGVLDQVALQGMARQSPVGQKGEQHAVACRTSNSRAQDERRSITQRVLQPKSTTMVRAAQMRKRSASLPAAQTGGEL